MGLPARARLGWRLRSSASRGLRFEVIAAWLAAYTFGAGSSGVGDVAAFVTAALQKSLPLVFVIAACIVLAPVALYFVLSEEKSR